MHNDFECVTIDVQQNLVLYFVDVLYKYGLIDVNQITQLICIDSELTALDAMLQFVRLVWLNNNVFEEFFIDD